MIKHASIHVQLFHLSRRFASMRHFGHLDLFLHLFYSLSLIIRKVSTKLREKESGGMVVLVSQQVRLLDLCCCRGCPGSWWRQKIIFYWAATADHQHQHQHHQDWQGQIRSHNLHKRPGHWFPCWTDWPCWGPTNTWVCSQVFCLSETDQHLIFPLVKDKLSQGRKVKIIP